MIDPPPVNWADVMFDSAAARDAAGECDRFADLIELVAEWNDAANADLQVTWRGGLAQEFEGAVYVLKAQLSGKADALRIRAIGLRRAADAADLDQGRRERQRDDWHDWDLHRRRVQAEVAS